MGAKRRRLVFPLLRSRRLFWRCRAKRLLLEPIGNIPPAQAEERYYAMLNEPAIAV